MEQVIVNITVSAFYIIFIGFLSLKYSEIKLPILIGGAGRLVLSWLIGLRILEIPGTTSDAVAFEQQAYEWSQLSWSNLISTFDVGSSYVISTVGAIFYKVIYTSPVMLNIINAAISVWLIVLSFLLAKRLFGTSRGKAAAWIIALFPYAVLYGSVFRREAFGSVFLMLALLAAVKWDARNNPALFALSLFFVLCAAVFHGGFLAAGIGLVLFSLLSLFLFFGKADARYRGNTVVSISMALVFATGVVAYAVASGVNINTLGQLDSLNVAESIEARVLHRVSEGGSSYPDFLRGVDPFANPFVLAGRLVYFLFSPFPWDISAPVHLLGFFATVLFIAVFISIYRSRKIILKTPKILMVAVMVFSCILVFGISIDNVGTSIRHRTKFIYALVALCGAPVFSRLRLRMSNHLYFPGRRAQLEHREPGS